MTRTEKEYQPATCQFCLADANWTPLGPPADFRCPVCGAAYAGPRRDREYQALVEAGLTPQEQP
jgi:hypothetical protein